MMEGRGGARNHGLCGSSCSRLGRRKLTHVVTAAVCLTNSGTHAVLWRSCSQYKQITSKEDLPAPMENPYKEPLKNYILCGNHVDYKNIQLLSQFMSPFTGCIYGRHITGLCGNKKKSQKELRELQTWQTFLQYIKLTKEILSSTQKILKCQQEKDKNSNRKITW